MKTANNKKEKKKLKIFNERKTNTECESHVSHLLDVIHQHNITYIVV